MPYFREMKPQAFQPSNIKMKNGCHWNIESREDLDLALDALKSPNYSPSSVHITHTPDMEESKFNAFWFIIMRKECLLSVSTAQFREAGQPASADTKEFITSMMEEFKNKTAKCTLSEYRGPLSMEDLSVLPKTVKILGLPLSTRQEADIVASVLQDKSTFRNLQELYVSVAPSVAKKDVEFLGKFCKIRFGLMFYQLQDNQVKWMMDIVTAMDKPFQREHVCVDEIYLPGSRLTIKGLSQLRRLLNRSDGALKYPIFVESHEMHEAARNNLQTSFEEYGGSISFNKAPTDFRLDFLGRKPLSKTHGYGIARYIGSALYSIVYSVWSTFFQSPDEIKYLVDSGV